MFLFILQIPFSLHLFRYFSHIPSLTSNSGRRSLESLIPDNSLQTPSVLPPADIGWLLPPDPDALLSQMSGGIPGRYRLSIRILLISVCWDRRRCGAPPAPASNYYLPLLRRDNRFYSPCSAISSLCAFFSSFSLLVSEITFSSLLLLT